MSNRFNTFVGTGLAFAGALTLLLSGCAPQSSGPGLSAATASITKSEATSTPVATTSPQPTTAAPPTTSVAPPAAAPVPPAPIASAPPTTYQPPVAAAPLAQSQQTCGNDSYLNSDNQCVHRPQSAPAAPPGATARCTDGTYSYSQHRSGTCSHHGGVAAWL